MIIVIIIIDDVSIRQERKQKGRNSCQGGLRFMYNNVFLFIFILAAYVLVNSILVDGPDRGYVGGQQLR